MLQLGGRIRLPSSRPLSLTRLFSPFALPGCTQWHMWHYSMMYQFAVSDLEVVWRWRTN
jgi:hypothetical protein